MNFRSVQQLKTSGPTELMMKQGNKPAKPGDRADQIYAVFELETGEGGIAEGAPCPTAGLTGARPIQR